VAVTAAELDEACVPLLLAAPDVSPAEVDGVAEHVDPFFFVVGGVILANVAESIASGMFKLFFMKAKGLTHKLGHVVESSGVVDVSIVFAMIAYAKIFIDLSKSALRFESKLFAKAWTLSLSSSSNQSEALASFIAVTFMLSYC
jgi:hypothetical protein